MAIPSGLWRGDRAECVATGGRIQAAATACTLARVRVSFGSITDSTRLEALEIKCAYLEQAVQELSDVVYRQQQQLDRVLLRNQELARQIESLETTAEAAGGPRVEIPPHY